MSHPARVVLALTLLAVAASGRAATVDVTVTNFDFAPQTVTIDPGDTVMWTNIDGFHSVTADDLSFEQPAAPAPWTYSRTFTTPGTYGYYCNIHGGAGSGMFGTVVVRNSAPTGQPGTLRLSLASYSAGESAGAASIAVQRLDGSDGAVSVQYAASGGSATAGQDFTAVSGTLNWGDGDSASKSFQVPIASDNANETDETVLLALSNPGGGATLDPAHRTATLSILDDDAPTGGSPPAAPSGLQAAGQSTTEVALSWVDQSSNENGFRIEQRSVGGSFQQVATAPVNATAAVVGGLEPSAFYLFRVRATGAGGFSGYSNEAEAATLGTVAGCVAGGETLCVNNNRFRVTVGWRIPDGSSGPGHAVPVPSAPDSGLFYFFGPSNLEMLIKVLNACVDPYNHYWVFYSATTNVEFAVVVTDTHNGKTRAYFNPLNRSAPPVQDVSAFATCP